MADKHTYLSMKQASVQLDIPIPHIKAVKLLYPDAFFNNNKINADKLKDYYTKHKDKIVADLKKSKGSFDELKQEKLSNDISLQKLKIAELQGKLISMEDLEAFLQNLGLKVSNVLLQKLTNELPQRLDRVECNKRQDMCKDAYNEIVGCLQAGIDNWLQTQKDKQVTTNEFITTEQAK